MPDVAFRASIQSLANEALSSVRPSSSERLAITGSARERTLRLSHDVCVFDVKMENRTMIFSDMGEAEAPAPPPAVPQNPIKIFISGNSGNKEVRAVQ